ncbi:MAG TPA: anti-sigma factor [Kofleriaceae bacterium]|nr:anti-sigma factor [Kofleriaceae bacterium]
MATQCKDIETLLPTYLDGELAPHDRLSFEHHTADCADCRERVREEAAALQQVRALLVPPGPPAELIQRVRAGLDEEDRRAMQVRRRAGWAWVLPGGASLAAAAALVMFVVSELRPAPVATAEAPAVRLAVQDRVNDSPVRVGSPQEVSVAAQQYLRKPVKTPQFRPAGSSLRGWQPRELDGRDAVLLLYDVPDSRGSLHQVTVHLIDASGLELRGSERWTIGRTELWVARLGGVSTVTYKDQYGFGYVFSSDMELEELAWLVVGTDIFHRSRDRRGE